MPTDPTPAGPVRHPGGCLQPVLLRGRVDHIDGATGELLHRYTTACEPGGVLPIACKTRRASRCPPVSSLMATLIKGHNEAHPNEALPPARLHDLRHVHATTLLLAGTPVMSSPLVSATPTHRSPCASTPT